jgi:cellulose synthase/poly-beta-1,6-N-acetylglucosamine synthase-like glycosyltransferase
LVIAGIAEDEGQKVHNLRQAVLEASPESEIFVFVDSDARPGSKWLKHLVAPLSDDTVGCSSGYRWFLSEKGGFWSELLSVWNASIASALGRNKQENFCWGGSMAIRRSVFESVEMREKWRGTLSDDFTVMRAMREAGLDISFVPQCLTASFHDANFSQMLEFTTRQMKITRVYASEFWKAATIGAMLFSFIFWLGVLLLPFVSGIDLWLLLGFIAITLALGVAKAWIRHRAVRLVLKDHPRELARQFKWQLLLWPLTPLVYLYNGSAALFSNKIIWRGITYELKSPVETVIISRNED